ncbi:MAG: DUF4342 domain-containing protein [Anaerovoracaceae bacterium]
MEITLEKIELVKDKTGVSYKEAKEALEKAEGSVVDAIISIEEEIDKLGKKSLGEQGTSIVNCLKELVKKGNVSKIVIRNKDNEIILNVPVTAGILGVVVAPWGMIVGAIASFGLKCVIEVVKTDGTIIEVSDKANVTAQKAKEKGTEVYEKVTNSEAYEKVKDVAEDTFEKTSEFARAKFGKNKDNDFASDFEVDFEESEGEEY